MRGKKGRNYISHFGKCSCVLFSSHNIYIYIHIYIYIFTWRLRLVLTELLAIYHSVLKRTIVVLSWDRRACSGWCDILKHSCILFQRKCEKKSKRRDGSRAKKISQSILGMPQKLWNESWNKFKINISCVTYVNICLFLFQNLAGQFIDRGIWGSRSKVEFFPEGHPRRWEVTLNPFVFFMTYSFLTHVPAKESGLVQVNNFFFFFFSVSRPLDKSNFSKISENSARSPV